MPQPLSILFGAVFCAAVSLSLGKLLLRRLKAPLYRQEEHALAFVIGSACLSLLLFALAAGQLLYDGVFWAVGILALAAGWRAGVWRPAGESFAPLPRRWLWVCAAVAAPFVVLTFFHAMAPEMSPDGSAYHLGLVARYYRQHGFSHLTTNIYGNLTQGVEMLFLFAFAFGRHSAAALVHFSFLLALPLLMVNYGRRFGIAKAGLGAALLVFVSPVVGIDGASAYNDVAVAAILFTVFYLVQVWDQTRENSLWIPIGLAVGFAFASKYTAFWALPYALGFLVWRLRRKSVRAVATVSAVALLMIVPWLAKNEIVVSNPVSPFFNRYFPNPYVTSFFEEDYAKSMRNYDGLASRWDIPLEVTVRGRVLCGLLGPLFLLAPLGLAALGEPLGRRILAAGLLFGSVYAANIGTRFLIPALPFVALSMALVFVRVKALLPAIVLLHAVSAWPSVIKTYSDPYAWRLDRIRLKQALRVETEDGYLTRMWPNYSLARMIESQTPPGASVLTFNQVAEAYTTRNILVAFQSALGLKLRQALWTAMNPDFQPTWRQQFHLPKQEVNAIRIRQTKSSPTDLWTISEIRLYDGGKELPRESMWRLQAYPNPWDVQLAFDNDPVTTWESGQHQFSGMYVEIAFGRPERVDEVVIERSSAYWPEEEVDVLAPGGRWQLAQGRRESALAPPPPRMRRAATRVLLDHGVRYVLVGPEDYGSQDFAQNAAKWGITQESETGGVKLYRINDP